MHQSTKTWMWGLALALPLAAQAQVNLKLDRGMTGPRAQVLVLGTVHLSELPEGFDPARLQGVIEKLAAFKPEVITIEAMTGEECDLAARHPTRYGSDYCPSTEVARKSTGLEVPAAIAEAEKLLADWPASPTPAQRRHLASHLLAANDRASAYAQWLQLPESERKAGDGLDAALVELLAQIATRRNENYMIAARLAAHLGLPRVYATDNHTGDNVRIKDEEAFGREVQAAWKAGRAGLDELEKKTAALKQTNDLLPLYRYVNEPGYQQATADVNVKATLGAKSKDGYPQMWVAGWEIRNLRMVANIRESFRERPGARVLTIVGASHKPWFDHWLGQMQGVDMVDALAVLK
ncbi:DUF5694 domain-containing protein [Roseateles sp. NT4]|uniref:DUF5694 domain-containing protein n=1 Tax=Roseateles sp. NT4 TaxID=3453715 RepID=UPI003EEE732E